MCSREELVLILGSACSQNPSDIKAAEEKLRSLETEKGFYHALASVVSDVSATVPVRWQAVLYVKNGIDRYWRKTAPNAICNEERAAIKTVLLGCLGEPGKEVALQIAVVIGKIARFDVPREWPELLPALMAAIQNAGGNDLVQHRDENSPTQLN